MAFDNEEMIALLKERGQAIRECDTERVAAIENKINEKKHNHYHTPIAGAFIIFEDDRHLQIVKQNLNETKAEIQGKPIKFKRAAEPTDYIWENLHYSKKH